MRYDVSATVKNYSDAFEEFFTSPGLVCLVEAFLEFLDIEIIASQPAKYMPQENTSMDFKKQQFHNSLNNL